MYESCISSSAQRIGKNEGDEQFIQEVLGCHGAPGGYSQGQGEGWVAGFCGHSLTPPLQPEGSSSGLKKFESL